MLSGLYQSDVTEWYRYVGNRLLRSVRTCCNRHDGPTALDGSCWYQINQDWWMQMIRHQCWYRLWSSYLLQGSLHYPEQTWYQCCWMLKQSVRFSVSTILIFLGSRLSWRTQSQEQLFRSWKLILLDMASPTRAYQTMVHSTLLKSLKNSVTSGTYISPALRRIYRVVVNRRRQSNPSQDHNEES